MSSIIEAIKNKEWTVSNLVKNKWAYFEYYRGGSLYYKTEDGFEFPIPAEDTKEATFEKKHKAVELMRWIRKQVDVIQKEA